MQDTNGEVEIYGLDGMSSRINYIVETLNLKNQHFEIKLIISEAVNNAFVHGNKCDKNKPIYVKWKREEKNLTLVVTDSGNGIEGVEICNEINERNILEESGRGLFIINSYADDVKFIDNSIIIKKCIL